MRIHGSMGASEVLPLLRELFSRNPEYRAREPWELRWLLFSLRCTNELEHGRAIEDAQEVALGDSGSDTRAA